MLLWQTGATSEVRIHDLKIQLHQQYALVKEFFLVPFPATEIFV